MSNIMEFSERIRDIAGMQHRVGNRLEMTARGQALLEAALSVSPKQAHKMIGMVEGNTEGDSMINLTSSIPTSLHLGVRLKRRDKPKGEWAT